MSWGFSEKDKKKLFKFLKEKGYLSKEEVAKYDPVYGCKTKKSAAFVQGFMSKLAEDGVVSDDPNPFVRKAYELYGSLPKYPGSYGSTDENSAGYGDKLKEIFNSSSKSGDTVYQHIPELYDFLRQTGGFLETSYMSPTTSLKISKDNPGTMYLGSYPFDSRVAANHEYGHYKDHVGYDPSSYIDKFNTIERETRAWDAAGVPITNAMRRAALDTYISRYMANNVDLDALHNEDADHKALLMKPIVDSKRVGNSSYTYNTNRAAKFADLLLGTADISKLDKYLDKQSTDAAVKTWEQFNPAEYDIPVVYDYESAKNAVRSSPAGMSIKGVPVSKPHWSRHLVWWDTPSEKITKSEMDFNRNVGKIRDRMLDENGLSVGDALGLSIEHALQDAGVYLPMPEQ